MKLLYKYLLKPILFRQEPERVHDFMVRFGARLGRYAFGRWSTAIIFDYKNPALEQKILGISFKNPIGLAAGFDKNAELTSILPAVGFGFAEVGSITGEPCAGNPKPRLWRLPQSRALVVYYGLKNDGCEVVAKKLRNKKFAFPLGVSVAMTNCQENSVLENGIKDFAKAFKVMEPMADYLTVNISCPNTAGGQPFTEPKNLEALFLALDKISTVKPIFIKFSPDLSCEQLDALLEVARHHRIHGIICANLTKKRENQNIIDTMVPAKGGISGLAMRDLADEMLAYLYQKAGKHFTLIGCGGIFTAEDAYKKIRLGASLVQMITGMIFEGPQVISEINRGLVKLLKRDGYKNLSEAVGTGVK